MAVAMLYDAKILVGGFDLSGVSNKVTVNYSVAPLNATVFGRDTVINQAGVFDAKVDVEGFWGTGPNDATDSSVDKRMFPAVGQHTAGVPVYQPIAVGPRNIEGTDAPFYAMNGMVENYQYFGQHGELIPFMGSFLPGSKFVRGFNIISGSKVAPGNGTAYQLGAVSATQRVFACLHVPEFVGTTVTFTLASDNAVGFPSSTTQHTFTAVTAARSAEWVELPAGAITDDWWRVAYAGTFTSFTAYLVVAIMDTRG